MESEDLANKKLQEEEIESLSAIFLDEFILESDNTFCIKICNSSRQHEFYLQVTFPESYPLYSSPKFEISAPWMERSLKNNLCEGLDNICCEHKGECIIYLWIDFIKKFIQQDCLQFENKRASITARKDNLEKENTSTTKVIDEVPTINHGNTIKDRRSVFQAHHAVVVSEEQVNQVLEKLMKNSKIATAKHNIYAYRIKSKPNVQGTCKDDGEAKAGPVILHLLEVLNLTNILIVVTRWYGGIHLGSDRYRHIKDAAKNLINELGLAEKKKEKKKSRNKPSRSRKKV